MSIIKIKAKNVHYDGTSSGIDADNVQEAIDENAEAIGVFVEGSTSKIVFEDISATISGTISTYSGTTIYQGAWEANTNAILYELSGGFPNPTKELETTLGDYITASIDANGNYTLSGTPTATEYCIVWILTGTIQELSDVPESSLYNKLGYTDVIRS